MAPKTEPTHRGGGIRTHDLLVPNQALYQAKLRPETAEIPLAISNSPIGRPPLAAEDTGNHTTTDCPEKFGVPHSCGWLPRAK